VPSAFFLAVDPGERFCIHHAPANGHEPVGSVVYVHPFGEEMNKARRMAALQSRRLAAEGFSVLQIDLHGCGDSSGDLAEARWQNWASDVRTAVRWLRDRAAAPVTLWGLRLGALLAADIARDPAMAIDRLLLWQPVVNGAQFLSPFLRLRLAGEMLASGAATTAIHELQSALARGESLEIAGYELHPELASAIEHLNPSGLVPAVKHVSWIEVAADAALPMRPAARRVLDAWRTAGLKITTATVAGEPFWSTIEIAECEALLVATVGAMSSAE
jgi:exosortase A-associated hydrolase 2